MNANASCLADAACDMLEVVDGGNRPFCVLRADEVLRQGLPHRAVGLLVRDSASRTLLTWRQGHGWGLSSFGFPAAGQSAEDRARELLLADWGRHGPPQPLGISAPGQETGPAYLYLFEARVSAAFARYAARDAERHLLADYGELRGLRVQAAPLLSPALRRVVLAGLARPR